MFQKIFAYFLLYLNILIKGLFASLDIVYVHYLKYTVFPSFIISKVIRRKKLIFNAHGSDLIPENKNTTKLSPLKRYSISKCDGFIVPSEYYKNIILEELPNLKEKIFISPSGGIDTNVFYPEKNNQNNILTIGYVGRIDSGKGIEILINSFIELKKQRIEFKGYIIGNGSLFKHYEDEIIKLNLNHQVELLGAVEQNKLRKYYNTFDIFVFPTYRASESLGLVALEAMACGTPVIGSNIGEIKKYIKDGVNGFLFEAKNHVMLTQKIIKYSNMSDSQKIKMRNEAIKTSRKYSSDVVTKELVNYLEKIIEY